MDHKVLCIDDETHNLEALERLLRKQYKTVCVESGEKALDEMEKHSFSLIISDQKMPEMTGVEFFMKAKKLQPEAVRILLTGYTDLESVIDAINQGQIYRYITKPWDPDELLTIAAQAIEVFEMKGTITRQNRELQEANEQLKSLDQMKTDFMLLVNHELKTPLTGIFSYVQLLNEEKLNEDQSLYLEKIGKNTKRLEDLINDTLLITKINADQDATNNEAVNIKDLINNHWKQTENEFKNKSLNLSLKADDSEKVSNEKYINIVIKKLIHNCFSHAKPDTEVNMEISDSADSWSLTVKNQASKEIAKSVDELLTAFSTNTPILNHAGGTGLGLAVIQAIVKLFQGKIDISAKKKVFEIKLTFPQK